MEMRQVQYFLAICEEKNFTRAAKRCGVSQASVSNAIMALEQRLGGPLFYRERMKVSISDLGTVVRPHLEKLYQCAEDAYRAAGLLNSRAAPNLHREEENPDRKAIRPLTRISTAF